MGWIKAQERLPTDGKNKAAKLRTRYANLRVSKEGVITIDGMNCFTLEILQEWFPDIENL